MAGTNNSRRSATASLTPPARAAQAAEDMLDPPGETELSNGIVVRFKPVPPLALQEATRAIKPPTVPVTFVEAKGREEENPNDPDYLAAVEQHQIEQSMVAIRTLLLLGVEPVSVPDTVPPIESDEWMTPLRLVGVPVGNVDDRWERKLAWLQYVALERRPDLDACIVGAMRASGVTEADVAMLLANFRSRTRR